MAKPYITDLLKELFHLANEAKDPLKTQLITLAGKFEGRLIIPVGDARQTSWTEERRKEQGKKISEAWEKKRGELRFLFTIYDREEVMRYVLCTWLEAANAWGCSEHSMHLYFSRSSGPTLWKFSKVHDCYVALSRLPAGAALDKDQFLKDLKDKTIALADFETPRMTVIKKKPEKALIGMSSYDDTPVKFVNKRPPVRTTPPPIPVHAPIPTPAPVVRPRPQPTKEPADIWEKPRLPGKQGKRTTK